VLELTPELLAELREELAPRFASGRVALPGDYLAVPEVRPTGTFAAIPGMPRMTIEAQAGDALTIQMQASYLRSSDTETWIAAVVLDSNDRIIRTLSDGYIIDQWLNGVATPRRVDVAKTDIGGDGLVRIALASMDAAPRPDPHEPPWFHGDSYFPVAWQVINHRRPASNTVHNVYGIRLDEH
jgi:hypothetical protein